MQSVNSVFKKSDLAALQKAAGSFGNVWTFKRCEIGGIVYHSQSYKRVTARNNYTVAYTIDGQDQYASVLSFVQVEQKCHQASCEQQRCLCELKCQYFAQRFRVHDSQLPTLQGRVVVNQILKVELLPKIVALPLDSIKEKCLQVGISSGTCVPFGKLV